MLPYKIQLSFVSLQDTNCVAEGNAIQYDSKAKQN